MRIEIIGIGCGACRRMEAEVRRVVADLGLDAQIVRVEEIGTVAEYGLLVLPGLMVDGRLVAEGYRGRARIEEALREAALLAPGAP